VESGLAAVTGRMLSLLPAERAAALADGPVTIDLDTTDVEVYGRKKRGVANNHQGQRVGRPHVATWAETETVLAADLGNGTDDPRATAPGLLRRALAALPAAARAGRVAMRTDAGYFAGQLSRAARDEHIAFAIGAKRIAPLWRLPAGIADVEGNRGEPLRIRQGRSDGGAGPVRGSRGGERVPKATYGWYWAADTLTAAGAEVHPPRVNCVQLPAV
jgi:hypothetical protein